MWKNGTRRWKHLLNLLIREKQKMYCSLPTGSLRTRDQQSVQEKTDRTPRLVNPASVDGPYSSDNRDGTQSDQL